MSFINDNSESDYSTSDSSISDLSEIDEEEIDEEEIDNNIEDLENISDEDNIPEEIIEDDDDVIDEDIDDNLIIQDELEITKPNKVSTKRNKLKFNNNNIINFKKDLLFNFVEENEVREKCKLLLKDYCKTNRNLMLIEKCIYEISNNKEKYIYNIIYFYGMLKNNEISLMDLYKELKDNIINYKSIVYNNEKEKILYEVNLLKEPIKVVEGLYCCDKCGDKKTYNYSIQTRRADEPPTVFIHCTNKSCKFVKRMN